MRACLPPAGISRSALGEHPSVVAAAGEYGVQDEASGAYRGPLAGEVDGCRVRGWPEALALAGCVLMLRLPLCCCRRQVQLRAWRWCAATSYVWGVSATAGAPATAVTWCVTWCTTTRRSEHMAPITHPCPLLVRQVCAERQRQGCGPDA
jgi:hypothetical protein